MFKKVLKQPPRKIEMIFQECIFHTPCRVKCVTSPPRFVTASFVAKSTTGHAYKMSHFSRETRCITLIEGRYCCFTATNVWMGYGFIVGVLSWNFEQDLVELRVSSGQRPHPLLLFCHDGRLTKKTSSTSPQRRRPRKWTENIMEVSFTLVYSYISY